jgi:hypothetical protein
VDKGSITAWPTVTLPRSGSERLRPKGQLLKGVWVVVWAECSRVLLAIDGECDVCQEVFQNEELS